MFIARSLISLAEKDSCPLFTFICLVAWHCPALPCSAMPCLVLFTCCYRRRSSFIFDNDTSLFRSPSSALRYVTKFAKMNTSTEGLYTFSTYFALLFSTSLKNRRFFCFCFRCFRVWRLLDAAARCRNATRNSTRNNDKKKHRKEEIDSFGLGTKPKIWIHRHGEIKHKHFAFTHGSAMIGASFFVLFTESLCFAIWMRRIICIHLSPSINRKAMLVCYNRRGGYPKW